jgi:hypothetical protein
MSFAAFLQGSLKGQTSLKAPPNWATQASLLQAAADVVLPQRILRERDASQGLAQIAGTLGVAAPITFPRTRMTPRWRMSWPMMRCKRRCSTPTARISSCTGFPAPTWRSRAT